QRQILFDAAVFDAACAAGLEPNIDPKAFFEFWFEPFLITPDQGAGKITGYYEPVIEARRNKGSGFDTPFLRRPYDLVEISDLKAEKFGGMRFGRLNGSLFEPYFNRPAIDNGALEGRNLEIAYVQDPVDAFFAHVQGCARLQIEDQTIRVTYDGKSGHEFTGIGRRLIDLSEISADGVSMKSIRDWLKNNPSRVTEILHLNKSYIFFREEPVANCDHGPVAAAKVPITAGRSIAVDRLIHSFGLPFYVQSHQFMALDAGGLARLMIAQDTGSAILGPARADLFIGSGDDAGAIAGFINHPARFHILLPRKGLL
ncbi:MAG: murein transglycosylase A, partial [Notoacmeibacter sp.]